MLIGDEKVKNPIYIGTSGWNYDHWKGAFYQEDLPDEKLLEYYCDKFKTVEINNTFYQLPEKKILIKWKDTVPDDFVFSVKASRYITHMKNLKDPEDSLPSFLRRIDVLGDKLGPILFQLPPKWDLNIERIEKFIKALSSDYRYAFEFRDSNWFDDRIYEALEKRNLSFCIYEMQQKKSPQKITSNSVYIRLHGPDGKYKGKYDKEYLKKWAEKIKNWGKDGKEVYLYFNNDQSGYAPQNAMELLDIL